MELGTTLEAGAWGKRALGVALLVLCISAFRAAPAVADDEREARARTLFHEALSLADAGRWAAARAKFERALGLRWTAEIAYDVAAAWERSGQPVRAHRAFAELARDGRATEAVRAAALARAGALRGRVGVLVVRIRGTQERPTVLVDGQVVTREALGAGVVVAPGPRAIDVRAGTRKLPLRYAVVRRGGTHVVRVDVAREDVGVLRPAWL